MISLRVLLGLILSVVLAVPLWSFQLPEWVMRMTGEKQMAEVENPPGRIEKCSYQNRDTFYISSGCCDQYGYLYDEDQAVICAPDGGRNGQGDGKCPDYYTARKDCVTIWQDARTWAPKDQ